MICSTVYEALTKPNKRFEIEDDIFKIEEQA